MSHADTGHAGSRDYLYFRHPLPVRLMHWTNVVALTILLTKASISRMRFMRRPSLPAK